MNDRERFNATMHYQPVDRSPIYDFSFWDETLPEWHKQGLPKNITRANSAEYFGMDETIGSPGSTFPETGLSVILASDFDEYVVEDRGEEELFQQSNGVRVVRSKYMGSIPMHDSHLLVDRESWKKYYLPKLDPADPKRLPDDWDDRVKQWAAVNRDKPLMAPAGSLYGVIRDWMGVENLSMVIYDDPAWFEEMVETVTQCILQTLEKAFATGVQFDACFMWEDMCYNAGPLISPEHFKEFLVPRYRRITDLTRKYGVGITWLDSDGCIDKLLPHWLDAGVNCLFPIEVGTWRADPVKYRAEYGKELRMMGGVDKHIISTTPQEIEAEVRRLAPLVEEGGYIGFCDHRVPPDAPMDNYLFYLQKVREIWGKNINLRPMPAEVLLKNIHA